MSNENKKLEMETIDVDLAPRLPSWVKWASFATIISFGYMATNMALIWPVYALVGVAVCLTILFDGAYNTVVELHNSRKIMSTVMGILGDGTFMDESGLSKGEGEENEEGGS